MRSLNLNSAVEVICRHCQQVKPAAEFVLNRGNRQSVCVLCSREYTKKIQMAKRLSLMQKLSGNMNPACICCGETRYELLAIDHVNNDGASHRRDLGHPDIVHASRQGKQLPELQVLCHNCNYSKRLHGKCRHQLQNLGMPIRVITGAAKRLEVLRAVARMPDVVCACCGEEEFEFLAVDHIDNDGAQHRRENGNKTQWTVSSVNNTPYRLQVLCHSCNMAKGFYGACPHQGGTRCVDVAAPPNPLRVPQEVVDQMVSLATSGMSIHAIEKKTGHSSPTVRKILIEKLGVAEFSSIRDHHKNEALSKDLRKVAVQLAGEAKTLSEIGRQVGRSANTVSHVLKQELGPEGFAAYKRASDVTRNALNKLSNSERTAAVIRP